MANYVLFSDGSYYSEDELKHYGVPGMRWGHRKINPNQPISNFRARRNAAMAAKQARRESFARDKAYNKKMRSDPAYQQAVAAKRKKVIKVGVAVGATVAATALATYGAYKLNKFVKTKNCQIAAKNGHDFAEKMFNSTVDGLRKGSGKLSGTVASNSGRAAIQEARRASNYNFRTALKNVYRYKKGGGNLRSLRSVGSYNPLGGSRITFG